MDTPKSQLIKIGDWTYNDGARYETILIFISILAIMLRYFDNAFAGILLVISMSALAVFYYFSAYASVTEDVEIIMKIFTNRLANWASSIAIIGILFTLKGYQGNKTLLMVGSLTVIFAIVSGFYVRRKSPESQIISVRFMARIIVIAIVTAFLYITPKQTLIDLNLFKERSNTVNIR